MRELINTQEHEQQFRTLLREAPFSAALLAGSDFIVEMANETTLRLWGKDIGIIGQPLLKAMPEVEDQKVFHVLRKVFETGITYEGKEETAYLEDAGILKKVYVNFVYKAIRNEHQQVTGVLAVGYDVTDQVVARQKLAESEERTRLAVESAGIGTFDQDYKTAQIIASARFSQIFGYDSQASLDDYLARVHPEDRVIWDIAQREAVSSGSFSYDVRLLLSENAVRWIRINGSVIFDETKNPIRLIGTARDITDEKESIRKLQESELRFRTLISETRVVGAGLYIGPEMRIQYVNDVMLRFWGKDESIIGKTMREALPELEGQPFFDQLREVYETGGEFTGREVKAVLLFDGHLQTRYFNYTYKALRVRGEVYAIHNMAVDVTDQVRNKLRLIESEKNVRRLFKHTPVGIGVFKGESLIVEMANDALLTYWGRTHEQVIDRPLWKALPEVAAQGIDKITKHVFETGIPYVSPESPISVLRNGKMETIYVYFAFMPQRDEDGKIIGLLGIASEVTDQVNARKKVEKNEMRLQNLANSMPQVVWIAEEDGTVTYYNDRVNEFAGARRLPNGNWSWEGFVHEEDLEPTQVAWQNAVRTKKPYQAEHRVLMKDGTYRWHLSRAYPFKGDEGVKWYGTATDVNTQKLMEMDLENLVKERTLALQRSNDDLQQFAHVASHDLKEPIRKIKTFSHRLQADFSNELGERGRSYINKIIHSTDRMYAMINGVLNYSSLPSAPVDIGPLDLTGVIQSIETDLEILIQEKKASIRYHDLPTITGIPELIYQLFYNLINNSLKFSKAGTPPVIEITSSSVDINAIGFTQIVISDNGIGFDGEYADQIFVTFFRLNSKDEYEGTGIGLSLCKKIVERHGGFISARGNPGEGAEFTIQLPA